MQKTGDSKNVEYLEVLFKEEMATFKNYLSGSKTNDDLLADRTGFISERFQKAATKPFRIFIFLPTSIDRNRKNPKIERR